MIQLLYSTDPKYLERLGKWVTSRLFMTRILRPGDYTAISVADIDVANQKSTIIAGVLYYDHRQLGDAGMVEVSMFAESPKWATRGVIRALMHYPFVQLNCHVMLATTNRSNRRTRKLLMGLGFKERGIIPNRPHFDDTVIYALRREDAQKWLPVEQRKAA